MSVIKYGRTVPEFVKRLREENDWSQEDLGQFMGVTGQYVSNIERGVTKSAVSFCALLLPVCSPERKPYLMDLVAEASSLKAVQRLKTRARVVRRPKR